MEFITAEQFLKEDKEVQEVFIDWWKPSTGDLFKEGKGKYALHKAVYVSPNNIGDTDIFCALSEDRFYKKEKVVPLLTEGKIRKFIEDKTGAKYIELEHYLKTGYDINVKNMLFEDLGNDLLQAYWKVAVQIAKKSIDK